MSELCNCANRGLKFEVYVGKLFQCRDFNFEFLKKEKKSVIPRYNACSLSIVRRKLSDHRDT